MVIANVSSGSDSRHRIEQLVELLNMVSETERRGVRTEAKRWEHYDATVKLYRGRAKSEAAIWAAVAIGDNQRSVTLIKIVDWYRDGDLEHSGLLADALDRYARGTVIPGTAI
ncbi:MAG: hypothetical protein JSR72_04025 [Proteobacteria bacterium]|nr:hypothetical protein [Pseudomonadota bacterium]